MKKSVFALFFALLCTSVLLTACKQEPKKEAESTAEPEQLMQLAKDKQTEFQIVSYLEDEAVVKDFAMDLFIRTSAKFELVHDGSQGEHTIYLGSPEDFRGKGNVGSSITYTNYEISISDGNIYVCLGLETMAEEVLSMLKNSIQKNEDGSCTLPQSLHISGDACQISQIVPTFVTGSGALRDLHDVGNGNYQASYENIDEAAALREIEVYRQTLADDGYTLWQENEIEGSCFLTYYKDDTLVHLNYFMPLNEIRIVYGPKTYLPDAQEKESYEKMVEPSVSIIQGTENVLCMVIQTADGQFYIIDGGWDNVKLQSLTLNAGQSNEYSVSYTRDSKKDMEVLYQFLLEKAPAGELPQVNWMITHADPDHILLPTRFIKDYAGKIDLKTIIYNVPNLYNIGLGESAGSTNDPAIMTSYIDGFLNNAQQYYPDAERFVYHAGQKLYIAGGEIEFLFAAGEDFWPNAMPWMNHTSGVWRFTVEGKTIMITGDAEKGLCKQMVQVFGSYLQSDILQTNHHGSNGATLEFYQAIDPTICFWSCHQYYLDYDNRHNGLKAGYEFNLFLRTSEKVTAHYSNSETHTVLLPSLTEE